MPASVWPRKLKTSEERQKLPNQRKLDAYESNYLDRAKRQKLMNGERQKEGKNIKSTLFQLI
jgi:hypothetical protein